MCAHVIEAGIASMTSSTPLVDHRDLPMLHKVEHGILAAQDSDAGPESGSVLSTWFVVTVRIIGRWPLAPGYASWSTGR